MTGLGIFPYAIAAAAVGVGLLLLVWGVSRWLASRQPRTNAAEPLPAPVESQIAPLEDAVLVARAGGRVMFANKLARDWFGLDGGDPDLMVLARQANPPDSFLELFAAEGRTTFEVRAPGSLASFRRVEATSHRLPLAEEARFVVVLHETASPLRLEDERAMAAVSTIAEMSQAVSASLDLDMTLDAVLTQVARAIPYDVGEITLWDAEENRLRVARRHGDRDYTLALAALGDVRKPDSGYSGWLARERQSLLIPDIAQRPDVRPKALPEALALGAFLGVPLQQGDTLVGTLELTAVAAHAFDEVHLRLLETVSDQAAAALHNAQRFEALRRRVGELSGLAEVAEVAGSLTDPYELYGSLTERIAKLMRAQICGVLLFDEEQVALVAQPPFFGLPDALAALYKIPLPAGSRVHSIWREAEFWWSNDVAHDPVIEEVGLTDLAVAIGARQTLIVPLPIGGQRLGVVQVSNKPEDEVFDENDARQLAVLAGQAAALIDNARLVRETRVRAERAEGLRRLAGVVASAQPLDDILRATIEETVRLLAADMAAILLMDEARGDLFPHAPSASNMPPEFLGRPALTMADPLFRVSAMHTRRPFLTNSAQTNQRLNPNYRAMALSLGVTCFLNVPLIVQERGIGELLVGARRENAYGAADLELVQIIAGQIASAIERANLSESTDESLRRRVRQLTALSRVSRQLNQTLQLERILTAVYDEVLGEATDADYASIALFDAPAEGEAVPAEALPRVSQRVGNVTAMTAGPTNGASGNGAAPGGLSPAEAAFLAGNNEPHSVRREAALAEADRLADDASAALMVPIVYQESIVGLIHLQSRTAEAFEPSVVDFVRALADQTAVAVGNAQRYEEQLARNELLRRRADQLSQLFQISRSVRADQPLEKNLENIAFGVQESTGFDFVIMSLLDRGAMVLEPAAAAGLPLSAFERIKKNVRPWKEVEPLMREEHRISQSYFIPRRKRPDTGPLSSALRAERHPVQAGQPAPPDGWQPNDLLLIPFHGSAGEILGLMHLDEPRDRRAPDRLTIETLEIFANQAALAIESARLYQTAEERAAELAQRLTDLSTSYGELDQVSRSLVQKDQELTRLVDELDLRNRRLLSVHHVIEVLGTARDPEALARLLAEAVAGEMQMEACVIVLRPLAADGEAEPELDVLRVAAASGFAIPPGADLAPLLPPDPGANPIAHTFEHNTSLLVRDAERSEWANSALIIGLTLRAFACVPILLRGRNSGALFVASQKALISFSEQDLDLFIILASQLGVSLENAQLYDETQRRLMEQTLLYGTSQELARAADSKAALAAVAERMVSHLRATALRYYSLDEPSGSLRADYEYWTPQASERERQSVQGQNWSLAERPHLAATLAGGQPAPRLLRRDDPALADAGRELLQAHDGQAMVAVPLVVQDRVLGYFEIWNSRRAHDYTEADLRLVQALANQAAVAYESIRLYDQTRQFNVQLEKTVAERTRLLQFERDRVGTLLRITSELSASLDLDRVLQRALALVNEVLNASQGSIFLVDPLSDRLLYRAALGRVTPLPPGGQPSPFARHEGLVGWVIRHREAVVIGDLEADPRWEPGVSSRPHRSALAAPLVTNDDILGAIMFVSSEKDAFNADQLSLVSAAAAQVASAINNAELYRLIRDQAERLGGMLRSQQVEASKNRAILESIADGVMVADAEGRLVLLNAAAEKMLNLSRDILGRPASAFVGLYGPAGQAWAKAIARWQVEPSAYQPGDFLAERFELEDKRVISVHLAPVTAGDDYLGSVSLFRDITREVEVDRLKTEFVTTVSHELRTPLTPIKGYVDALLLGMAGTVEERQRQILGVIKSNIDRLSVLVNDLLDISRIESGKVDLELQPVSVAEVVDEVAAALQGRMGKEGKNLALVIDVPPGLPPMLADRLRIAQVMTNLAFNAFNYTPDRGTITISAREQSGLIQVSVRDTGIGIAPDNIGRIFERFYRGENPLVLATAGTGLGLSIVKSVIEMHDGRLWAESEGLGKGSTFTFLVPPAN